MTFNIEYIDLILMAMIVGFIFLRLRNVLGRRTGNEPKQFRAGQNIDVKQYPLNEKKLNDAFDEKAKKQFIEGAKLAYETIITSFAKGDKATLKTLLGANMYKEFNEYIDDRNSKKIKSETTFIGIKSAKIEDIVKEDNLYKITVNFVSEIITCLRDKDDKIIEGDPDSIKTVKDEWKFSKNMWSQNPTWYLIETANN
mgnify:FL=1